MRITRILAVISSLLATANLSLGGPAKLIAFYAAPYVATEPDIDGNLNDSQWKKAFTAKDYYQFGITNPGISDIKTELKVIWTKKGIGVGIVNHEKNPEKIKARISLFDSGDLWKDDCAEIYFDPKGTCIGAFKFMINSLGTRADLRWIDTAVFLPDWSAPGWRAAAKVLDDRWIIEAFFPWSDFDEQGKAGDLWRFEHIRFSYSTGKFQGSVWSPEGMAGNRKGFGYLYFYKDKPPTSNEVGRLLSNKVAPPWMLPYENKVISCKKINEFNCCSIAELKDKTSESVKNAIESADGLSKDSKNLLKLKAETEKLLSVKNMDFAQLRRLQGYDSELNDLLWKLRLSKFVDELK